MKHEHHHDQTDRAEPSKSSPCCDHMKNEMHKREMPTLDSEGVIYTCPMHLEIRQSSPGNCPICGMALEPVMVNASNAPNHEYLDMRRRFWLALILTLPVFVMEMSEHWQAHGGSTSTSIWIQMILSTPVVLWSGWPFFQR